MKGRRTRQCISLILVCLFFAGCDFIPGWHASRPIPELNHAGYRKDVGRADRGNALFTAAMFTGDGSLLITTHHLDPLMRVWDARGGRLISAFEASPADGVWMLDSPRRLFVGKAPGISGFAVFDLMAGKQVSVIPAYGPDEAFPLGLTDADGSVVFAKPGSIEVWQTAPARLLRSGASPLPPGNFRPSCVGGIPATYNDKKCWEISPGQRWMALASTPTPSVNAASRFFLIDLATLEVEELTVPDTATGRHLSSFAFSPDDRTLAFGTDRGIWFYDIPSKRWGPFVAGDHRRNKYLGAMRFTGDNARLITLGDQAQVSVFDRSTGSRLGRWEPPDWDREAVFAVSADGSGIVVYRFVSDVLEILDGNDARKAAWVCPYFCNAKHNPVQVQYAVSPDGRAVAASHNAGSGVWDTKNDRLLFPLHDRAMPPLKTH
jgi:WD40 repeat protein